MASLLLTDNRKGKCAMTKRGKKKGLVAALSVVAVIVLLAAAYGIFCLIIEDDKIWADASINGVNIQGMSKKEAAQTVEQKFEEDYKDTAVTVELDGQQYTMNVFPMLGMDASAEIEKEDIRCRIEAVRSQVGRTHPVAPFGFDVLVHGFRRIILKAQIHTTHFSCLGIHLVGRSPKLASDHAACIQAPSQAYPRGFLVYLDT